MSTPQEQTETLRHVLLEALVARHPAALPLRALIRAAAREVDFQVTEPLALSALALLEGRRLITIQVDHLGSTRYYSATHDGVLDVERRS